MSRREEEIAVWYQCGGADGAEMVGAYNLHQVLLARHTGRRLSIRRTAERGLKMCHGSET